MRMSFMEKTATWYTALYVIDREALKHYPAYRGDQPLRLGHLRGSIVHGVGRHKRRPLRCRADGEKGGGS